MIREMGTSRLIDGDGVRMEGEVVHMWVKGLEDFLGLGLHTATHT